MVETVFGNILMLNAPAPNIWGTADIIRSLPYIRPLVRTSRCRRFVLYSTLGHMGGSNRYGGYTQLGVAMTMTLHCGRPHHMIQNTAPTWTDTVDSQC
jgi:hypothetical protein